MDRTFLEKKNQQGEDYEKSNEAVTDFLSGLEKIPIKKCYDKTACISWLSFETITPTGIVSFSIREV